jgi:hypothetical protein
MTRAVSLKGVLLGGMADFVATNILVFPIMVVARFKLQAPQLSGHELSTALLHLIETTPWLHAAKLGSGLASCMLGGYVAARIAKRYDVLNGALSAWLGVALTSYDLAMRSGSAHVVATLTLMVAGVVCAACGGYLALRSRRWSELVSGERGITSGAFR